MLKGGAFAPPVGVYVLTPQSAMQTAPLAGEPRGSCLFVTTIATSGLRPPRNDINPFVNLRLTLPLIGATPSSVNLRLTPSPKGRQVCVTVNGVRLPHCARSGAPRNDDYFTGLMLSLPPM